MTIFRPYLQAAAALAILTAVAGAAPVGELEALVSRWIDLRTQLAAEESEWARQKEHLSREIDLLEREKASLALALDDMRSDASAADEARSRALADHEHMDAVFAAVSDGLSNAEKHLKQQVKAVPPSLRHDLAAALQALPLSPDAAAAAPVTRRAQAVIALYSQLETLQSRVHFRTEIIETGDGEQQVDVLYLGLARGFAVSPDASWAAVGVPGDQGWTWNARPGIAPDVRQAIRVFNRDVSAARGVAVERGGPAMTRRPALLVGLALLVSGPCLHGAVEDAISQAHTDIKTSTAELVDLRESIAAERAPLVGRLRGLEDEVDELRSKLDQRRRARTQERSEQEELEASVAAFREDGAFLSALLSEYRRAVGTRVHPAQLAVVEAELADMDTPLSAADVVASLETDASRLFAFASRQCSEGMGGTVFRGKALDVDGMAHSGHFAVFGPMAYFAPDSNGPAGMVATRPGSLLPTVLSGVAPLGLDAARALVSGSEVMAPVDLSGGDALRVGASSQSLVEHLEAGGVVIYPLLVLAVLALVLAVLKIAELGRISVPTGCSAPVLECLRRGDLDAARAAAEGLGEPLASLLQDGIAHSDAPKEHIEEIMHERILAGLPRLERHLGTLAVFGGIAPLLGLLGTVTGMIHTFQLVTIFGTGEAKLLSGGISEALVTTEVGLVIAIPVLLVHAFLARRVRTIVAGLETVAVEFVNGLTIGTSTRPALGDV